MIHQYSDYLETTKRVSENLMLTDMTSALRMQDLATRAGIICAHCDYENTIYDILQEFANNQSFDKRLAFFVVNTALKMKFFQLFNFGDEAKPALINSFTKLFGDDFKQKISKKMKDESDFRDSIQSFYEIETYRNSLSHEGFSKAVIQMSINDLETKVEKADKFIEFLKRDFCGSPLPSPAEE